MEKHSASRLFLLELIFTILFLAVASSVCIRIFAQAHQVSQNTEELNAGQNLAASAAEVLLGTDGSYDSFAVYFPQAVSSQETEGYQVYYNADWEACSLSEASYCLSVQIHQTEQGAKNQILVTRCPDEEDTIYDLEVYRHDPLSPGKAFW